MPYSYQGAIQAPWYLYRNNNEPKQMNHTHKTVGHPQEKILANHIPEKELISKIYKELIQLIPSISYHNGSPIRTMR